MCPYNIHSVLPLGVRWGRRYRRTAKHMLCYITLHYIINVYYKYILCYKIYNIYYKYILYYKHVINICYLCYIMYCIAYYICYKSTYTHETIKPVRIPGYYS